METHSSAIVATSTTAAIVATGAIIWKPGLRSTTRQKRKRRLKLQVQVSQSISPLCQFV